MRRLCVCMLQLVGCDDDLPFLIHCCYCCLHFVVYYYIIRHTNSKHSRMQSKFIVRCSMYRNSTVAENCPAFSIVLCGISKGKSKCCFMEPYAQQKSSKFSISVWKHSAILIYYSRTFFFVKHSFWGGQESNQIICSENNKLRLPAKETKNQRKNCFVFGWFVEVTIFITYFTTQCECHSKWIRLVESNGHHLHMNRFTILLFHAAHFYRIYHVGVVCYLLAVLLICLKWIRALTCSQ